MTINRPLHIPGRRFVLTKNMIEEGIVDPLLVTKSALKNAVSIAKTIISADCVISNMRTNESN